MEFYSLYFDGSCGPKNPGGTAAYGFVLSKNGRLLETGKGIIGQGPEMSNNLAEHYAVAEGMKCFLKNYHGDKNTFLHIRGDSQLVVNQLQRKWRIKAGLYYNEALRAMDLLKQIRAKRVQVNIAWIPRDQNQECDALSKEY